MFQISESIDQLSVVKETQEKVIYHLSVFSVVLPDPSSMEIFPHYLYHDNICRALVQVHNNTRYVCAYLFIMMEKYFCIKSWISKYYS